MKQTSERSTALAPVRRVKKPSLKEMQEKNKLIASLLKKHNAIIHIEGSLSLVERKLYNVLLLNAYDQLEDERTHSIPLWILCEMMGYNSNNVSHLQVSLKSLQSTILEVNLLQDGKRVWDPQQGRPGKAAYTNQRARQFAIVAIRRVAT